MFVRARTRTRWIVSVAVLAMAARLVVPTIAADARAPQAAEAAVDPRPAPATQAAAAAVDPRPALASFEVDAAPEDQLLVVGWSEQASHARSTWVHLQLLKVTRGQLVVATQTQIGNTVESDNAWIPVTRGTWVVRATPENAAGFGTTLTSAPVTVSTARSCPTATVCVRASSDVTPEPVRLVGQGFLLSLSDWSGNMHNEERVKALEPQQWRFSGPIADPAARELGVSRMQIISDLWNSWTAPLNGGYALTPWSDWERWKMFVRETVRRANEQGWAPDYWDVWNEPNGMCCPLFSPVDQQTTSVDRWLRTYVLAWKEIKAVDPTARVIGPSLSGLQWHPSDVPEFDLDTFLAYSAEHGVVWDAVSWHENSTAPSWGDITWSVRNVDRHIALARRVIARHPGTVVRDRIFVNEYGPENVHTLAGWTIGYLRALENGDVAQANRTCWTEAECTSQLGGLVTPDGDPTATWWAHRAYFRLAGLPRMTLHSSASWQVNGLATRDDVAREVRLLLGRHWSCNQPVNPWCEHDAGIGPASVKITIDWPYGSGPVRLSARLLPAGTGAVPEMRVLKSVVVRPRDGKFTMTLPTVPDGAGISIVAH